MGGRIVEDEREMLLMLSGVEQESSDDIVKSLVLQLLSKKRVLHWRQTSKNTTPTCWLQRHTTDNRSGSSTPHTPPLG